jgi:hypothetical protein
MKYICGLLGSKRGVNRHNDRTQQQACEVGYDPFVPVFAEDRDPVAARNPPSFQCVGQATDFLGEFLRGNRHPAVSSFPQHELRLIAAGNYEKDVVQGLKAHAARLNSNAFRRGDAIARPIRGGR